ncbi:unnamed protein product [Auanema sp. JU1783]|nr:unnamed protein product [Auanema sp. JU1783]
MEQGDELPPGISAEDSIEYYENKPSISQMESHDEEETEERTEDEDLYDDVNPLAGSDDDDDDDVQVTIGKIEPPVNVQFNKSAAGDRQVPAGKLDIDTIPMLNDKPIYDVDLATMDDRPWRKPGADITDYFNYGFTEDSWNTYCERQKKLRLEFTSQAAVNKAIFSNIHIANPLAMPSSVGGRQLVSLTDNNTTSNVKVLTDNGGRFKPHFHKPEGNDPIVRTVIGGAAIPAQTNSSNSTPATPNAGTSQAPIMDFSKPPPGMTLPPTVISSISQSAAPGIDAPPGVETTAVAAAVDGPPGVDIAPPGETIQPIGSSSMDMSVPPPGFNPAMPPPGLRPMGMPPTNMPPPVFNSMMPPPGFSMTPRFQQVPGMGRPPNMMHRGDYGQNARRESSDFDDRESEDERRRYRRRSRSRSPVKRDRKRDDREDRRDRDRDRDRERERERDRDRGKERDRAERSRRHRSRSASPESRGKKRSDDRDKKRDRREEDGDRKKSRRHEDDPKEKERSSRHRRSDKSKDDGDSKEDREPAPPGTEEAGNA